MHVRGMTPVRSCIRPPTVYRSIDFETFGALVNWAFSLLRTLLAISVKRHELPQIVNTCNPKCACTIPQDL